MFKFQDSASVEHLRTVENVFHSIHSKVEVIHDFEWGINNSRQGLNKGLTHGFLVTFKREADRGIYLPHLSSSPCIC